MAKNIRKHREKSPESKGLKHRMQKRQNKRFYASTPKKQKSAKRNPENELIGIYKQMEGGFGFVDRVDEQTGKKEGFYVHESKKLDALEGDEVAFEIQYFRGKPEAVIKKVLQRSDYLIVGTLKIGKTFAFVLPENKKIGKDIFIPGKFIGGYPDGARVAVQVLKWEGKNPEGRIIEPLASLPKGREDIYKIAFEMGARKSFSPKTMEQVRNIDKKISKEEMGKRKDFRKLLTYTIDGVESKDLDDALSIEKTEEGYRLYVHIADVAHYVEENTSLDREARKRATSIYLVDQVIPMLPAELSNGLCSLHPGEDKLTMTLVLELDAHGNVTKTYLYNSVIQSDFRLTYKEIDEINSEKIKIGDELTFGKVFSDGLRSNLQILKGLAYILEKKSQQRGNLDFDFPETKIILDDAGKPVEYKKYERYDSYKIIEVCMVLANEYIGRMGYKHPFIYRVHEEPDEVDIEKFEKLLAGITGEETKISGKNLKPKIFQEILEKLKANPRLEKFQKLLLRTLSKAIYSEKNLGHFGLALEYYTHFTSPIRRYPDLQAHRILKDILTGYTGEKRQHYKEILPKVARHSSEKSEKAEKMEYKVRDMLACKYMSDKIGQEFTGKISGMIEKGFFVELENTIEGFIEFGFTGFQFDSEKFALFDNQGNEKHFGDEVQVRVLDIDFERFRIEFELV